MRRFLGFVVVVAVLAAGGYFFVPEVRAFVDDRIGQDNSAETGAGTSPEASCELVVPDPPVTVNIGVVIDPSSSTAASFSEGVIAGLAAQLRAYLPAKPAAPQTDGVATANAVNVRIKQVGNNPYAYGAADLYVEIPGVQGLPERPGVNCMASGTYQQWTELEKAWSASYDAALADLETAVQQIQGMPLYDDYSGIRAALSALVASLPPGDHAAYLVASDFEENRPPQTAGTLNGHALILIAACPSGDAARCSGDVQAFGMWAADSLGAGSTSVYRPEQANTAINQLFEEAER
jgi:hypothetical protein